jgi:hypothetical protein
MTNQFGYWIVPAGTAASVMLVAVSVMDDERVVLKFETTRLMLMAIRSVRGC